MFKMEDKNDVRFERKRPITNLSTIYINKKISQHYYDRCAFPRTNSQTTRTRKIKIYKLSTQPRLCNLKKIDCTVCKSIAPKIKKSCSAPFTNVLTSYKCNMTSKSKSNREIVLNKYCPFKSSANNINKTAVENLQGRNSLFNQSWKIYRCQFNTPEENCCCSCNSDAMFEVMKSLYDCYKKKNCDNCNCILCGHLPREERRLGELRKSEMGISISDKEKEKIERLKRKSIDKREKLLKDLVPIEKLQKAKAEGLLTPLEGKDRQQREKILRGLAMNGIPFPATKTASDKKLADKVRKDLGLPPEPLTSSERKKYNKAMKNGLVTPLEGKGKDQKEKILKRLAELGVSLPEGRTTSELSLIRNIKATTRPLEPIVRAKKIPSEILRKAEAEGLLTPLEGKDREQKEKILRGLAMNGIPFPATKTASDKKLADKVRKDFGLPPESLTSSEKIKAEVSRVPLRSKRMSEKLKEARAAGLLTPLVGKKPEEKEKILRGLAMAGIPLPQAKTASEQKIIDKVRDDIGLPPEPKTSSLREHMKQAQIAGIITPLEGKTPAKKEQILRKMHEAGILLPKGRTSSEKSLIERIKGEIPLKRKRMSVKLKEARAAGLLTPLEGKKPEEKEKILRGLAMAGIPLPQAKTASEQKIIDKVRDDVGLPPEPKTSSLREQMKQAQIAGIITPLDSKTPAEKEQALRKMHEAGIPLPKGRTSSEKSLIERIKAEVPLKPKRMSEKLKEARAAGLLTPLVGKKPEEKEKILRGLAMAGIPLPQAKTASEQKVIDKVRDDVGLPPEPKTSSLREQMKQAQIAGIITPLEGKTPAKKEQILRKMHDAGITLPKGRTSSEKSLIKRIKAEIPTKKIGIAEKEKQLRELAKSGRPMPEGKTLSEKALISKIKAEEGIVSPRRTELPEKLKKLDKKTAKIMKEGKGPSDECICGLLTPESKRISKISKFIPPTKIPLISLEGKTRSKKEIILKDLARKGIPLPEPKTFSEKQILQKVRDDLGLPPTPETPSLKEKFAKAQAAGIVTPLEGKTHSQKQKILTKQAELGIPLPAGRTPSEKALIEKVRATVKPSPLVGKTKQEKEKYLRSIAKQGLPLPEPQTSSDKAIVDKVRAEFGLPSVIITPSQKLQKARAAGLLTPLEGKTSEEREKILKGLAKIGIPLPEAKTASEQKIIDKVRDDIGLPPEPKTSSLREQMNRAQIAGIITPLEGKTPAEKEKALRKMHEAGISLPKGRTSSEKSLIKRIKAEVPLKRKRMSEKLKEARAAGLLTPLVGKKPEEKEKILRGLALAGIPLPQAKTASEQKIIDKVRDDVGLPPEPKTSSLREQMKQAQIAGIITPLEGKTPAEKEQTLRKLHEAGIPLPKGRTRSEKSLIKRIKAEVPLKPKRMSEKLKEARAAGLLTPLVGKKPEEKEKILRGLAMAGIPLPQAKTASEQKIIDKVRDDVGLPPEPKTSSLREQMKQAQIAGIITPLEGKTSAGKEQVLRKLQEAGIPLPKGRTSSEKSLIKRIQAEVPLKRKRMSEKLKEARAAGLLTPLVGKKPEEKEKILRGLAMAGIPLPQAKTASEQKIIDKVREDVGLPPEPKTSSLREQMKQAQIAGIITPLEGKTSAGKEKALRKLHEAGIPLPKGRTSSEKSLIKRIKAEVPIERKKMSEKLKQARAAGLLTPLVGKKPEEKERILRGLAMAGIPLPQAKTASEQKIIDKVRDDIGLPPEPKTSSLREQMKQAQIAGIITPLEGKTPAKKEQILRNMHDAGIPLPKGRTSSEKSLIKRIKAEVPTKKLGIAEKEKQLRELAQSGRPMPEGKTLSEKALISKIKAEEGIVSPRRTELPEKLKKLDKKTAKIMKEGKGPSDECICGLLTPESKRISRISKFIPPTKTPVISLEGKTRSKKEIILKDLARKGIPLPEPKTFSEKQILQKVRDDLGLPPTPETPSLKEKFAKAQAAGIVTPLEGKTHSQKQKILTKQAELGIPLPAGRTPSEKALIEKVRATVKPSPLVGKTKQEKEKYLRSIAKQGLPLPEPQTSSDKAIVDKVRAEFGLPSVIITPSQKLQKARAAGLLTPLEGKTSEEREKILKGLAKIGVPLPEAKTASEQKIIDKVRDDIGLPPEPKTSSLREQMNRAQIAGIITPLEGKTPAEKEKALRKMHEAGISLPKGRTSSEKSLIKRIKAEVPLKRKRMSEKLKEARAAGLLTPLVGKKPEEKEKILRGLALAGIPLPQAKTASEQKIIDKVRDDVGLPPEPKTSSLREQMKQAQIAGIITPLEGKTSAGKEQALRKLHEAGIPMPKGRTRSEKSLIKRIKAEVPLKPKRMSEKLKEARAAGLLTPLVGKKPEEKEKILRGLAMAGIPLPQAKTASEQKIIDKVREDVGLPPEPKTSSLREQMKQAQIAGIITPLEGKTSAGKEKALRKLHEAGIPLPKGRTSSEKSLIKRIKAEIPLKRKRMSEKLKEARAAGLLTPLIGKKPEEKEKILRGLAMAGIPLPQAQTASEQKIIDKVRDDIGLPPEPKTSSLREQMKQAQIAGIITPLERKTPAEKERALRKMHEAGIPLPKGRTSSEKSLIERIKGEVPLKRKRMSEKLKEARAAGLLTPLVGKTPEEKERVLRGLAMAGIPLPQAKTASERKIIGKVRDDIGLPPEPKTSTLREQMKQAQIAGIITPLEGKTPAKKEQILRKMHDAGIPLPKGRTISEKSLIKRIKAEVPTKKIGIAEKEKQLRELAKSGRPMPEGKTLSEKALISKIKAEEGIVSPRRIELPEKLKKLDKKTAKIMKEGKGPSDECICGLLTPESKRISRISKFIPPTKIPLISLERKTRSKKEIILKDLARKGIPLPEPKTFSEKQILQKVRDDLGLPPTPETPSLKEKFAKAQAAGIVTPLEGKTHSQKQKILTKQAELGIPLPAGRTPSEKALIEKVRATVKPSPLVGKTKQEKEKYLRSIAKQGLPLPEPQTSSDKAIVDKVRAEFGLPSVIITPSQKIQKARAAGLLTPLEGKTSEEREKILKGLAKIGVPLPEAKTASEQKIIDKVRRDVGLPPEPRTPSLKEKMKQAQIAGIVTPLEGKTTAKKALALRKMHEAGIQLPEGRTSSEKSLIQKILREPELAVKKVKTKSKKIGVGVTKSKMGIVEEFEDIIKTTTCDRGCGCDKKKIRFKHSYVKIRVTSPDISSLCPCPEECVPGVKGGVFTNNEGIKVTVGMVTEVASFPSKKSFRLKCTASNIPRENLIYNNNISYCVTNRSYSKLNNNTKSQTELYSQIQNTKCRSLQELNFRNLSHQSTSKYRFIKNQQNFIQSSPSEKFEYSNSSQHISITNNQISYDSIYLLKTISSLSLLSLPQSISVPSFSVKSTSSSSTNNMNKSIHSEKVILESIYSSISTLSFSVYDYYSKTSNSLSESSIYTEKSLDNDILICRANDFKKTVLSEKVHEENSVAIIEELTSNDEMLRLFYPKSSQNDMYNPSSFIIIMSTSSEDCSSATIGSLDLYSSTLCLELSENQSNWNSESSRNILHHLQERKRGFIGIDKNLKQYGERNVSRTISIATPEDRPCCCATKEGVSQNVCSSVQKNQEDNIVSELVTPKIMNEVVAQVFSQESYKWKRPKDITCSSYQLNYSQKKQTPVGLCNVTSCKSYEDLYKQNKSCNCTPEKVKKIMEDNIKQLISRSCSTDGLTEERRVRLHEKPIEIPYHKTNQPIKPSCISCGGFSSDKDIKQMCPCQEHDKNFNFHTTDSMDKSCSCYDKKRIKRQAPSDKQNVSCECPEEPEPQIIFDPEMIKNEMRKHQSDLTQATSGFKVEVLQKSSGMSFEETLRYYAENLEDQFYENCNCDNKYKIKGVNTECECPYDEPMALQQEQEPFKGIKFHIEGKGTTSKGLSGILCFP